MPDPEDGTALTEGEAAVGEVVEGDEQPAATTTSRAAEMARRFMVRVWSICMIRKRLGA